MVYYRRKKRVSGKRKRWYIDASIPKSVPFIGGSSFKAGSGNIKRSFKRAVTEASQTKIVPTYLSNGSMTHSIIKTWNITAQITQGNTESTRIGDKVFLKKFTLKNIFDVDCANLPTYTSEASCRVMVIEMDAEYLGTVNAVLGTGVTASDAFYNTTVPQWSSVDYRKVKVICDHTYNFKASTTSSTGATADGFIAKRDFVCNLNKYFTYKGNNSAFGRDKNIYLVLIPFCKGGTTGVTAVFDQWDGDALLTFKDI